MQIDAMCCSFHPVKGRVRRHKDNTALSIRFRTGHSADNLWQR